MTYQDPQLIFETLASHEVQYVVIGGLAVQTHGHVRTTRDVDIVIALDPENFERAAAALHDLEAQLRGVDAHLLGIDVTDPVTLHDGANFTLTTRGGDLDVFTDTVPGAAPFEELFERSLTIDAWGVEIRVVGLSDLLAMKQAAGRPRDLSDIAALTDPLGDQ